MADKSVGELIAAKSVTPNDNFVLEQNGTAKKLTGQILENWLVSFADGHGGIQSIAKLSTSGLADTYRITLADTTTFDFVVNNGRGITGISKTGTSGLVDTYTISYNNGTTSTFTVKNGEKGDKGDNTYVWIKYASQEPTESSHSMGDIPDDWIGIYSGNASTAPTDWKKYQWFKHKGEKGDTGNPATLVTKSVTYQVSDSGTIVPSGSWVADVPSVQQGKFLWTRTVLSFNTGNPVTSYSVSRFGLDGTGAVNAVNGKDPDNTGNVRVKAEDITTSSGTSVQAALDDAAGAVKTVNGKGPDGAGEVTLGAADVGARPDTWVPTAADVGARPDTWVPTAADVGAVAKSDVLTAEEIEASTDLTGKVAGAEAILSRQKKIRSGIFNFKGVANTSLRITKNNIIKGIIPDDPFNSLYVVAGFADRSDPGINIALDEQKIVVHTTVDNSSVAIKWFQFS